MEEIRNLLEKKIKTILMLKENDKEMPLPKEKINDFLENFSCQIEELAQEILQARKHEHFNKKGHKIVEAKLKVRKDFINHLMTTKPELFESDTTSKHQKILESHKIVSKYIYEHKDEYNAFMKEHMDSLE